MSWTHRRLATSIRLAGKSKAFSRCSSRTSRSKRLSAPAKTLSGFKFGPDSSLDSAYRYFADQVPEVFVESAMAFFNPGHFPEMESICLPRLAPMAGSTIYQTTGAGIISTRVRFLGQLIYNKGGLLLRIGVK